MGKRFELRGTSLDAHISYYGKTPGHGGNLAPSNDATVVANASPGVFGGSVINMQPASVTKYLTYPGRLNIGEVANNGSFSVRARLVPTVTVSPYGGYTLLTMCEGTGQMGGYSYTVAILSSGKVYVRVRDGAGNATTLNGNYVINAVQNVPFDVMVTWNGQRGIASSDNAILVSVDGVEVDRIDTSTAPITTNRRVNNLVALATGYDAGGLGITISKTHVNELTIWDTQEPHVYAVRTDFDADPAFDGLLSISAGAANIRTGVTETISGVAIPGTLVVPTLANTKVGVNGDGGVGTYDGSDRWTDPSVANVRSGIAYKANSEANNRTGEAVIPSLANTKIGIAGDGGVGTYDGSDRWSDPGAANVLQGVTYEANDVEQTGSYSVTADYPAESDVREGVEYDSGILTGTLDLPPVGKVQEGTTFDNETKTGTLAQVVDAVSIAIESDEITVEVE